MLTAVLAGGLVQVTAQPVAAQEPSQSRQAPCPAELPTEVEAAAAALKCGGKVGVAAMTSETTLVWALPSGGFQQEIQALPVRVKQDNDWVPVDLTLTEQADGTVAAKAHPLGVTLSGATSHSGENELAAVGSGDDEVAMGWTGPLPEPELEGPKATYREVKPGVDLIVEATYTGIESFYVVKNRDAADEVAKLVVPIAGDDIADHQRSTDGTVTLVDDSGEAVASTPPPLMWDARTTADGDPAAIKPITMTTADRVASTTSELAGAGATLTLTPDQNFLNSPDTVYPVTVDPQLNGSYTYYSRWMEEGSTAANDSTGWIQIGYNPANNKRSRAFIGWNSHTLTGKYISSATVSLWNYESGNINAPTCAKANWEIWSTERWYNFHTWTSQPVWYVKEATTDATWGATTACDNNWATVDATSFWQRAADAGQSLAFMGIRATNENAWASFKKFSSRNAPASMVPRTLINYSDPVDTDVAITGIDWPLNTEISAQDLKAKMQAAGYSEQAITSVVAGDGATATASEIDEPETPNGIDLAQEFANDDTFEEEWAEAYPGTTPPPADGVMAQSMFENSAPYQAENPEEQMTAMGGTGRHDIVSMWDDVNWGRIVLRYGYYQTHANGQDNGFGLTKVIQKHNLDERNLRNVTRFPKLKQHVAGQKYNYTSHPIIRTKCTGNFFTRKCKNVARTEIILGHDFRIWPADHKSFGVITAFCKGYDGKCPNWVKNRRM
ncbi:DNRLRE domain-containing protein [Spirilliplanes yamanashiensis]|uniref:DNRLRE domain-containing protein n=1 Tax=Spirilliplanes yamanashiensis TaxID=42233 RepID=UPI00194EECE1|nr:DNRLRE domain-containing protein [Spirilliplanes yamanashiensis]MDP9818509.1 hypothetical protein [Spirilliplanes yamanashiensis]